MVLRASLAFLLLPVLAMGQAKKVATDWRDKAKKELKPAQVDVLAKQKFVVGDETYRQVFTPYLYGDLPAFVTSDSVLNAFHVLLEESVYRLERVNAARLPAFLEHAAGRLDEGARGLPAKAALLAAAKKRAQIFLGTAVRLHKVGAGTFDKATAKLIQAEVARVTAARGASKSEWLGPKDRGFVAIDYSRFQPRGFYTRSPEMQRYFRVVSWLQAIPFRVEKEEELLAALILSRAAVVPDGRKFDAARRGKAVLAGFGAFLGSGDDWSLDLLERFHADLEKAPWADGHKTMIQWLRAELLKRAKDDDRPQINDQLTFIPDDPKAVAEVSIRVATAYRLPDAVLFQRTTDPRRLKRKWPSGLDVAAALGSPLARRHLRKAGGEEFLALIDRNKKALFHTAIDDDDEGKRILDRSSLYQQYLDCLGTLVATVEPDWPAFMKGKAWQAKTCQSALGGWAQMRHTWVLQAKLQIEWLSASRKPSGFVEPVPEFYRKFGRLCERFTEVLEHAGAFADDERASDRTAEESMMWEYRSAMLFRLEEMIAVLEKAEVAKRGAKAFKKLSAEDRDRARELAKGLKQGDPGSLKRPEQFRALLDGLRKERDRMARREIERSVVLGPRWQALQKCCARLECLSHKQLRGRAFAGEENTFLAHYGETLGWLMFYDGNSYQSPRDDAPRVVDVFAGAGKFLEVGIAQPRALYVLYPWQGKEVLCRGAVLPYHEFLHDKRLTDEAWRDLLKTSSRPGQPAWAKPLTDGARQ
jgi:hypothetical protein